MQTAFLLSGLESRYPQQVSARIVAALRQDQLVWSALEDEDLYQRVMEAERGNPLFWSPANIGLILLGADLKSEVLAGTNMPAIDTALRNQAVRLYEEAVRRGSPPANLRDATLLALALRERKRTTGNWIGLATELLYSGEVTNRANGIIWRTVIAVLVGIIPDPSDLLSSLIKVRDIKAAGEWVIHSIISTPYEEAEQARKFAHLLLEVQTGGQIEVLKSLKNRGLDELTTRTANLLLAGHPVFSTFKMKVDLDEIAPENLAARALTLQQLAALNQLSGSPAQADACLRIANAVLQYWQSGLELQSNDTRLEVETGCPEDEIIEKLPVSRRLVEEYAPAMMRRSQKGGRLPSTGEKPTHPMLKLLRAIEFKADGNSALAMELGVEAASSYVDTILEQDRPFVGDFIIQWNPEDFIDLLISLELFDEAEQCVDASLKVRPTDGALLSKQADLLCRRGKFSKANHAMRMAVSLNPNNINLRRKLAEINESAKNWEEAFLNRKSVLGFENDGNAETCDRLAFAKAALHAGKPDQAVEVCDLILSKNLDDADAQGLLGMALAKKKKQDDAIVHLNKATLLDPENPQWWLELSGLHRAAGDRRQAYEVLRAAVMAAPETGEVYFGLGEMLMEDGLTSEALPYLRRAADLQPEDANINSRLGKALHHLGHLTEARFVVERVRGKWPLYPELAYEFANIASEMGDEEQALQALEIAVHSERPQPEWLIAYAKCLLEDHSADSKDNLLDRLRFIQAESLLQNALKDKPDDKNARIMLADTIRLQGDYERALQAYQVLAEDAELIDPDQIWKVQHGLGLTAMELNLVDAAIASLRDAAQHRPEDLSLQQDLANACIAANLPKEAVEAAENALDLAYEDADNLSWFAKIMAKAGQLERAEEALRTAVQISPDNKDLLLGLAQVQLQNGHDDEALSTLSQITRDEAASPSVLQKAAHIYMQMQDIAAAQQALERAIEINPQPAPDLLVDLAHLYDQIGDLAEALAVMQKVNNTNIKDANSLIFQADLFFRNNQPAAALTSLETALELTGSESGELEKKNFDLQSEIFRMMAAGLEKIGNLKAAYECAEKALERTPDDLDLRAQTAEMALTLLNTDRASELAEISPAEGSTRKTRLALLAAETALERNNLEEAVNAWEEVVGDSAWKAWQLAIESRLDARSGDFIRADEIARKSIQAAEEAEHDEFRQLIWAGKAAVEAGLWDDAKRLFQTYQEEYPVEPLSSFELAKTYVRAAERQRDCQELGCVMHAPGENALSNEAYIQFKHLIERVATSTQSSEAARWMARGEMSFAPSIQTIKEFGRIAVAPVDTAAIVRALRTTGNWPSAALAAQQAPDEADVQFQLALGYLVEDPDRGYAMISALAEKMPRNPLLLKLKSMLAKRISKDADADAAMDEALIYWPDEVIWHSEAAELAERVGDTADAVRHWKSAAHLSPANTEYALRLGRAYMSLGEYGDAVEALDRAARLNPSDINSWIDLAEAAKMNGQLSDAMEAAQKASQINGDDIRGVLLTSDIAREMGDSDTAVEFARLALRHEPQNPCAVLSLSKALTQMNQEEQSLAILEEKLSEIQPTLPLLFERARLVYKLKGAAAASALLARLGQAYPDEPDVLRMMAKVQIESNDKKGAERSAMKALRINPEQPDLSLMLGKIERELGQLDQAVHYLCEAIRLDPHLVDAYLELGQAYQDRREYGAAIEVYNRAISASPKDKRAYYEGAVVQKECKDYVAAEAMLQRAAKLDPDDLQIRRQLIAVMALNLIHKSQEANTPV